MSSVLQREKSTLGLRGRKLLGVRVLPQSNLSTVVAACATLGWFALLGFRALFEPDEGRYAEIPREMLQTGHWLIPHLNGIVYLEKPPLQYWMTGIGFQLFGQSEFVARLAPGIAGYLSLLVVYSLGCRLGGRAAGRKALLMTGASLLFVLLGHQLTLDMMLSFFLLCCLYCFIVAQLQRAAVAVSNRWMLGCWAAMAFAVLTKGLVGIVIPASTALLYAVYQRDYAVLRRLNMRWGVPLCAVVAAPWFILTARANAQFLHFFFIREHFERFLTPIEHRTESWWFFIPVLTVGIMPWLPLALKSLLFRHPRVPRGQFDALRVLWIWSLFVVVFFSLSDAKLIPYVLPAVPALALLCAQRSLADDRGCIVAGAVLSLAACIGVLAYAGGAWRTTDASSLAAALQPGLFCTAALLGAGGFGCLVILSKGRAADALAALCVGWFLASGGLLIAAMEGQSFFSTRTIADLIKKTVPASAPLYSVSMYDQSAPFYLKRTLRLVEYRDEFAFGLDQDPTLRIAGLDEFVARWRDSEDAYAVMRRDTRTLLMDKGLPMRELGRVNDRVLMSRR